MDAHLHAIGQKIIVPSSLTGALLEYFVPYPLTEAAKILPARSGPQDPKPDPDLDISSILPLVVLLSPARGGANGADAVLIRLHTQIMSGLRKLRSVDDLVELGREISTGNDGLRRQIVYFGGPTPSTASYLYPPPSELPELMESLASFMASDLGQWDPIDVATMVCEHAVRIHPFNDGNGRWARLLALEAGRRAGSLWTGACAGVLNQLRARSEAGRKCLIQIVEWTNYIETGRDFSLTLQKILRKEYVANEADRIWRLAARATNSSGQAIDLVLQMLSRMSAAQELESRYGWSKRKAIGFLESLADSGMNASRSSDAQYSEQPLMAQLRKGIRDLSLFENNMIRSDA